MTTERADLLVIGGGFFGTYLATRAARKGMRVLLAEAKDELLQAASLVNQARVHNGYHYPRSILTGVRSRSNFERFVKEFPDCVDGSFAHYYGIAREGGHITAQQFALFCDRIGAEYTEVGDPDRTIFDRDRIEAAFLVKEWAFNAEALRANMADRLKDSGVQVRLNCRVMGLASAGAEGIEATLSNGAKVHADMVLNCTYAELNGLIRSSGASMLPLKQELVEIALLRLPEEMGNIGWTIMDGPFCSSLPFPARNARSLYHVRYSTHGHWFEGEGHAYRNVPELLARPMPSSHVQHMIHDGARYVKGLRKATSIGSLWTVRTKLPGSARTDSRPILFREDDGLPRLFHVLAGKIDNVYDLEPFLDHALGTHTGVRS